MVYPPGHWQQGFRLLRNRSYNNSQTRRKLATPWPVATFAWAVRVEDLEAFYDLNHRGQWQIVRPALAAEALAIPRAQTEAYVMGRSDRLDWEPFNPEAHCVVFNPDHVGLDIGGNPMAFPEFYTPYEIVFSGRPVWHRNKPHVWGQYGSVLRRGNHWAYQEYLEGVKA